MGRKAIICIMLVEVWIALTYIDFVVSNPMWVNCIFGGLIGYGIAVLQEIDNNRGAYEINKH